MCKVTTDAAATTGPGVGFNNAASGNISENGLAFQSVSRLFYIDSSNAQVGVYVAATTYHIAIVLRAAGMFTLIKGGAFTQWTLLWIGAVRNTATLYATIINYSATFTADDLLVPAQLWLPAPCLSDAFSGAAGALSAHASDGTYFAEGGGAGRTWQHDAGCWIVSAGNKAVGTPTLGAEQATGNLVVGTWYSITASEVDHFYTGSAVGDTFRAAATTALDANNKVKAITLSSMFATVNVGTANVKVRAKVAAFTAKTLAGVCIIFDFDGAGNCKIAEFTTATTWNALATAVKAFTAADELELDISMAAYRAYHVTSAGVATLIASGTLTAALSGNVGIMSTDGTNTFSGAGAFFKGNENQYSVLDGLSQ